MSKFSSFIPFCQKHLLSELTICFWKQPCTALLYEIMSLTDSLWVFILISAPIASTVFHMKHLINFCWFWTVLQSSKLGFVKCFTSFHNYHCVQCGPKGLITFPKVIRVQHKVQSFCMFLSKFINLCGWFISIYKMDIIMLALNTWPLYG